MGPRPSRTKWVGARPALVAGLFILTASARGAAASEVVVLESYGGIRSADADRLLAPLLVELGERGFVTRMAGLGTRIEARVSGPGGPMTDGDRGEVEKLVEEGFARWLEGEFAPAVDELARAVERYHQSPATLAQDQARRDQVLRALVGIAMAQKRLGQGDAAQRAMAELVRSFPDREVSRAEFGPEAQALYREVKRELDGARHGGLEIDVDDDGVLVFVNERYEAVGDVAKDDLVPGRYRVYVQKERRGVGRSHEIEVTAGATQRLVIHWGMDAALRTAPFVGFAFASEAQRGKAEAPLATAVARAIGASSVVVVGIRPVEGRRALVGTVLSLETAKPLRTAALVLEPVEPGDDKIRGLARFLAGEEPDPGLILAREIVADHRARDVARPWYSDRWGWALSGAGLAVAGVGVGFLVHASLVEKDADQANEIDAPRLYAKADDERTVGTIAAAVGAAGLTAGVVKLILHDQPPSRGGSIEVAFGLQWIGLRGSFR